MSAERPRVRLARAGDIEALLDMRQRLQAHMLAKNSALFDMAGDWRARKAAFYSASLASEDCRLVVLENAIGETLCGMAMGSIIENANLKPRWFGSIDDVWVAPEWRRKGLARDMVSELLAFFESRDIAQLTLNFVVGNTEAEGFWARLGFQPGIVMANAHCGDVLKQLAPD